MPIRKIRCFIGALIIGVLNLLALPTVSAAACQEEPATVTDVVDDGPALNPRRHSDII